MIDYNAVGLVILKVSESIFYLLLITNHKSFIFDTRDINKGGVYYNS